MKPITDKEQELFDFIFDVFNLETRVIGNCKEYLFIKCSSIILNDIDLFERMYHQDKLPNSCKLIKFEYDFVILMIDRVALEYGWM